MFTDADFLAAIATDPGNDAPRLMYADWLDQQGQSPRAEFIRLQCAAAAVAEDSADWHRFRSAELNLIARHPELKQGGLPPIRGLDWDPPERGLVEGLTASSWKVLAAEGESLWSLAPIRRLRLRRLTTGTAQQLVKQPWISRLETLDLTGIKLTDATLLVLLEAGERLNRLTVFNLTENQLTDSALMMLARWPELAQLARLLISGNPLTGAGLYHLAASPYLTEQLSLCVDRRQCSDETAEMLRRRIGRGLQLRDPRTGRSRGRSGDRSPRLVLGDRWSAKWRRPRRRFR